eukprot:CAMPEP_0167761688 /NCGR_PEP_ID=MMETSP0110_2-20121227/12318_1 /TAXON_ID=629695 /ORGANISM="Gymnochlora sp., Strain CCMP2014" /LENGTH=56 /DNA_ID=CAMNT_0007648413 /DNA_START=146 /DNA_END=316 /DNA_ORIENTATION=+
MWQKSEKFVRGLYALKVTDGKLDTNEPIEEEIEEDYEMEGEGLYDDGEIDEDYEDI